MMFMLTSFYKRNLKYLFFIALMPVLAYSGAMDVSYRFKHLTVEDGLSNSTVYSILQDRDGYLWFGTPNGLNRYDGYTMTVFKNNEEDSTSISSNNAGNIYLSRDGHIWIGSWGGGLEEFDPHTLKARHYIHKAGDSTSISDNRVQSLYEDEDGKMWLGTFSGGLNRLDRETGRFTVYKFDPHNPLSLSNNRVWAITGAGRDHLWVGTSNGLNLFDKRNGTFHRIYSDAEDDATLSHNVVRNLLLRDSVLWIGTIAGISRYDLRTKKFKRYLYRFIPGYRYNEYTINSICPMEDGTIWFGSGSGVYILDPQSESIKHVADDPDDPEGLNDAEIRSIFQDRSGVIWLGTKNKGLNSYISNRKLFMTFSSQNREKYQLKRKDIHAISGVTYKGREYVLFSNIYGFFKYDVQTRRLKHFPFTNINNHYRQGNFVRSIYPDPKDTGIIWLGTQKQIYQYRLRDNTFIHYELPYKTSGAVTFSTVTSILRVGDNLWFGNYQGGLNKMNPRTGRLEKQFIHSDTDTNSLSYDEVYFVERAGDDGLWIGTGAGLDYFNLKTERFKHINFGDRLIRDRRFFSIYKESDSLLWLGTEDGLIHYNAQTGHYRLYTMKDGLPDNKISFITAQDSNILWLGTEKGLSRMDIAKNEFNNFNFADGLINSEYVPNASWRTSDGTLYFGGKLGLEYITPDQAQFNVYKPPVVLNNLFIANKRVNPKNNPILSGILNSVDQISLNYDDYVFSIEFAALDYTEPENIQYAYKLDGFDTDWIYTSASRRFATYTSLPGGEYTFKVKATNGDGIWNPEIKSLRVIIIPPFWKTPVFTYSVILLLLLLLAGIYRWRTVSIHRRNRELEEMNDRLNQQIVEREKAEAENKLLHEHLLQSQTMEAIGVLAGGIAHDFNNLLTAILGNLELSRLYAGKESKISELLSAAEKACVRARGLTQQLLTFSKGGSPIIESAALQKVVRESADFTLTGSAIKCEYDIEEGLALARIDKGQISQVVQNITLNAKEAQGDKGKIYICLRNVPAGSMNFLPNPEKNYIELCIRDEGPGIDEKHIDQIFTPYFSTKDSGNGLGLAVCFSVVEKHKGVIRVDSEKGKGTTFSVYLPASEEEAVSANNNKPGGTSGDDVGRLNILLMDDDKEVGEVARGMLTQLGHNVVLVKDGQHVLEKYAESLENSTPFDLYILDLTVPGAMGGREALEALKKLDPGIKALVSSGYAHDPVMANYREFGFSGVVAKPYTFSEMRNAISALF
ncbi:MAG TPA: hybrid sensor histidine kinase/response regulator [Caldithrix abyssi]|uniref:histidine kinase n=1 Tax=Caldithrix abyssi TaxID=187145 RepID=A0A7V1LNY6_CALAY|nr:hybrid sensor histidine kinase/response regulator [Caldithrix abyssi]